VVPFNSEDGKKTALLNILTTSDKQFTTVYEFRLSENAEQVAIINTWTLNDDLSTTASKTTESINGFEINTETCYADLTTIDPSTKCYKVGCALSMGQSHVTEFSIIPTGPVTSSLQRLRNYSNMVPIVGTLKANTNYVTYLAKSALTSNSTLPHVDPFSSHVDPKSGDI